MSDDAVWRYLFAELPFAIRQRWGGDWREFRDGVAIAASWSDTASEPQSDAPMCRKLVSGRFCKLDAGHAGRCKGYYTDRAEAPRDASPHRGRPAQ